MIEIKKSRKKSSEAFKDVGKNNSPLQKIPSHSQKKADGQGCYHWNAGKQGNRNVNIRNMADSRVRFKTTAEGNFNIVAQQHKVDTSLETPKDIFYNIIYTRHEN